MTGSEVLQNTRVLATVTSYDDREAWLAARRSGVGASDAAAICGLDAWRSPMAVWLDKVGLGDDTENAAMRWGQRLEGVVADEFAEQHPELSLSAPVGIYQHATHDWMLASPDRIVALADAPGEPRALLEIKTAGQYVADKWADGVPDAYQVQVQHQLAVCGLDRAWVAVLIGGRDYRTLEVARDDAALDALIDIEQEFWEGHVLTGEPPPVDGHESTTDALKRLYADARADTEVDLPADARDLLDRLRLAKAERKAVEDTVGELENQLRAWLGTATAGTLDGRQVVTWKPFGQGRVDEDRFAAAQPDVVAGYRRTVEVVDWDVLAAEQPELVKPYRNRPPRRLVVKKEAYR